MEHSAQSIQKHVRGYWIIGATLYVLTLITVGIKYLHLSTVPAVVLALMVASVKGSLVGCYFMHLISEKKMIYWALILTVIFLVVLMGIPLFQHLNIFNGIRFL